MAFCDEKESSEVPLVCERTPTWPPLIYLEVEVQDDDHLAVTRLEDGVFDVVVEDVHFIAADRREAETWWREVDRSGERLICAGVDSGGGVLPPTVGVRLQGALHPLLGDVGSDVQVFELGVAAVQVDDQRVLLDDALLLLLLRLSRLVALLHLFDDAEGVLEVGGGHRRVSGGLQVGRPICAGERSKRFENKQTNKQKSRC